MSIAGMRGVGDFATSERPRNFREMILWRSPNGSAPLTALMAKMRKQGSDDMEFNWWEEELNPIRLQKNGEVASTITTVSVDGGTALDLVVGDILMVEKAASTGYSYELVQVTSVASATTIGVTRAFAGTTKDTIADDTYLVKVGNAYEEGSTSPPGSARNPTKVTNYLQDFKTAYEQSDWVPPTRVRTGDPLKNDKKRRMFDHSVALEHAFLFGYPAETTGVNSKLLYSTGGLLYFLGANYAATSKPTIATIDSTLTTTAEDAILNATYQVFDYNTDESGDERVVLCGNGFANYLNQAARNATSSRVNFDATISFYGMNLQRWILPQGTLYVKTHPLMNANTRFTNGAFIINPSSIVYRYLNGKDTKMEDNIQANDAATKKGQWRSIAGAEFHHLRSMRYLAIE
jgi:hypothetical protein